MQDGIEAWQALVKLRPIGGDAAFGERLVALRDRILYTGDPFDTVAMRAMREKQVRQLVKPGTFNAKLSPGGLVDTEYLVQGFPGVSFVGDGNGTQLGAAADEDGASHGAVALQPGDSARAALRIAQAGNYAAAECDPSDADGFRVYPPGQTDALFVQASGYTACTDEGPHLLTVQALR